jgi:hypothetical protein
VSNKKTQYWYNFELETYFMTTEKSTFGEMIATINNCCREITKRDYKQKIKENRKLRKLH